MKWFSCIYLYSKADNKSSTSLVLENMDSIKPKCVLKNERFIHLDNSFSIM